MTFDFRLFFTIDPDDALAVGADFNDAVALVRKEITAFKKYREYGFLNLNPVEHTLSYSTG